MLSLEKPEYWLRATWSGYITPGDALRGASNYLARVGTFRNLYLLNDNTNLQGPWFDSVTWLDRVWLPQAMRLGLRYIAHVVQADTRTDVLTLNCPAPLIEGLELQLFDDLSSAQEWLRACQQPLTGPQWTEQSLQRP